MATEAGNLATQTRDFADDVQSTQDAIRDLCDRVSPSGIFDGIKAIFSGDALDEVKEIAADVQQVLENFGRQVDGKIALMESLITALDDAVVSLQHSARREFTQYLGEDVGGALATAVEFQTNVGEEVVKAGLQTVVGIEQLDPTRFASDREGATAAWGGVLDTLTYATPTGIAMDPGGAFEHGQNMLGGIVHAEDWRADRPGLGLGGVLFEAGSAATGVGAAKTGLRGVSAAAEAGEGGAAARAVAGAAESTAPITGRASEIAAKLDDLTALTDDIPTGATAGARGPALPPALTEPHVPEAPRLPEAPTRHDAPEDASPPAEPDTPAPHPAEMPHVLGADAGRAPGAVASEGLPPSVAASHVTEPSSYATPQPAMVGSESSAIHDSTMPASGSSGLTQAPPAVRPSGADVSASAEPEFDSSAPHESSRELPVTVRTLGVTQLPGPTTAMCPMAATIMMIRSTKVIQPPTVATAIRSGPMICIIRMRACLTSPKSRRHGTVRPA